MTPAPTATMRELRRSLVGARDEQIVRVVSYVDALPVRGDADQLLVPLRARLQLLRPPRPIGFSRLLFWPFDPVIMEPNRWRRDGMGVPRTALAPLLGQVRRALREDAAAIDAALEGRTTDDVAVLRAQGEALWERAGLILEGSAQPDDWTAVTGLNAADHARLARAIGLVLRKAASMETLAQDVANGQQLDAGLLRAILSEVGACGLAHGPETAAHAVGMTLAILLSRLPASDQLITVAADLGAANADPAARRAADQAIDFMLDEIETGGIGAPDLSRAADEISRVTALLDALQQPGPSQRPSRKARAERVRRQIDSACRARFDADLSVQVLVPAVSLGPAATDAELMSIETTTRALRRFEGASRELAGGGHYDRVLAKAADALAQADGQAIGVVDRARLVEILAGPERALALLAAE